MDRTGFKKIDLDRVLDVVGRLELFELRCDRLSNVQLQVEQETSSLV